MNGYSHPPGSPLLGCYISGVGGWNRMRKKRRVFLLSQQRVRVLLSGYHSLSDVLGHQCLLGGSLQMLPFLGPRSQCFTGVSKKSFPGHRKSSSHGTSSTQQLLCPSLIGGDESQSALGAFLLLKGLTRNSRILAASHPECKPSLSP